MAKRDQGFLVRFAAAFALVALTYNPTE